MTGADMIAMERSRQIDTEGWDSAHDSQYRDDGDLIRAAILYAAGRHREEPNDFFAVPYSRVVSWPWEMSWWKPTPDDRIRELVKAGALIAAEIDRRQNEL